MRPTVALLLAAMLTTTLAECPSYCTCYDPNMAFCNDASLDAVPRLPANNNFTFLLLSHNKLTDLRNGIFRDNNMIDVVLLSLADNNITVVESGAFQGLNNRLTHLILDTNRHIELPEDGFSIYSLTHLDLSRCNLEEIPKRFFEGMPNIVDLNLSENLLAYFDAGLGEPGRSLHLDRLVLSNNSLTKLDLGLVNRGIRSLIVHNNPFHCDCAFRLAYFTYRQRAFSFEVRNVTCRTPLYFKDVFGDQLLKMNLQCDPESGKELGTDLQRLYWAHLYKSW